MVGRVAGLWSPSSRICTGRRRLAPGPAARRLRDDRALLLVTSRAEAGDDAWDRFCLDPDRCQVVTLDPLSSDEVASLEREQDVVALVKKGLTNREVATELYVSAKAVEYHLRNVFATLGITSRRELRALDQRWTGAARIEDLTS